MLAYLRAANVKDGALALGDVMSMNFTPKEQRIFSLTRGDVLVTEGSGSLKSVGATAVWGGELDGTICFQNTLLRLRPRAGVDGRFLGWWARSAFGSGLFAAIATGANIYHVSAERVRALPIDLPSLEEQRRIADFLDAEVGKINDLTNKKLRLLSVLEERVDSRILQLVGASKLANPGLGTRALPIRRVLAKVVRPAVEGAEIITAFRDGQVTARSLRRADGYTLSASAEAQGQNVGVDDVVVHGLDGFAGAIGTAETSGNCSPVYHVCVPINDGDSLFYGRLLRVLAVSGYLGLFAISTRERAVDFRNWDLFGRIPVPDIPLNEQREIGDLIKAIRPLRTQIDRSNTLASERRQSLITVAVTGQIDVTTARGAGV
ncbi:restriction endonuclease subunit S [Herbidospora sp. NBRC 101105]|uniref:restriction endonuclease subunit S n=1 Tax=Herbidospora sp. NBRC 101105 TaxID=3032195 RepID=UPI0025548C3D|nr:restriction endonuclease subunit S [Herbidospora sp. NBRC 101105]